MGQGMKVDRFISTGPRRSTEQACTEISDFISQATADRSARHAEDVRLVLRKTLPLLRFLLPTRRFADPAVSVEMPELLINLYVGYGPDSGDDLSVPDLTLVDKLDPQDVITITLRTTAEVTGDLARLPGAASTGRVRVSLVTEDTRQIPLPDAGGETELEFPADAEPAPADDETGATAPPEAVPKLEPMAAESSVSD